LHDIAVIPNAEPGSPQDMGLRKHLFTLGLLADRESDLKVIVVENASRLNLRDFRELTRRFPDASTVLVRTEPQVVIPANFSKRTLSLFDQIFTLGGMDPGHLWGTPLFWPQIWHHYESLESSSVRGRKDGFALINANKLSFVEGENYSLRRMAAKNLDSVDLFGEGWDSGLFTRALKAGAELFIAATNRQKLSKAALRYFFSSFPNSFPAVPNKFQTLRNYKFTIVIENSNSYMSEKLFDAFFAGTIPIYVGPNPEDYGIPHEIYVYSRPTLEGLRTAILAAKKLEYEDWLGAVRRFLDSKETSNLWSSQSVYSKLASKIKRDPL